MTIASTTARQAFNCDGTSTVFPVNIQAYLATDFSVLFTNTTTGITAQWTLNSQYSMAPSGSPSPPNWTLTTPSAQPVGSTIQVILNPTQTQQTAYPQGQAFPSLAVQANVDRLTQMVLRLQDQVSRTLRAPDGDVVPGMQLVPAVNRAMQYQAYDVNGNAVTVSNLPTGTGLTVNGLGAVLYPSTQGERNALAPIVNTTIAPYNPLRYATNALPGITPMASAFQAAINSLLGTPSAPGAGGQLTIDMAGGPYNLDAGLNCTWAGAGGAPPITVRFLGPTHNSHLNPPQSPVNGCILNHATIGFDCTGNDTIQFIDPTLTTATLPVPTVFPKIAILFARNTTKSTLINRCIRPKIVGYFSIAPIYNYGSEGVACENVYLVNYGTAGAGNCCIAFTQYNYAGVQSLVPGLIAGNGVPGAVGLSMTCCNISGGQFIMNVPNATSDCVHIEGAFNLGFRDCFAYNPGGRSAIFIDCTFSPAQWNTIDNFKVDAAGAAQYTILSGPATASIGHVGWNIRGLAANSTVAAIGFADANSFPYNWTVDLISEQAPTKGIMIPGNIDGFSEFRLGATALVAGNVTVGSVIIGYPPNITVGGVVGGAGLGRPIWNNASQVNGFGTAIGAALIQSFNANTATPLQTAQMMALLVNILKQQGGLGA